MMNPFAYLRAAARNAVLGGISDAIAEATPALEVLQVAAGPLEVPALPPKAEDAPETPKKGRKLSPA